MLSVTAAALAGMLVYVLAPKGGTKKAVRMLAAVLFLTAFFLPFGKVTIEDLTLPEIRHEEVSREMETGIDNALQGQILNAQQAVIAQIVTDEVSRTNTPAPDRIGFTTDDMDSGGIIITQVSIHCSDGTTASTALRRDLENKIRETTGLEVQVVFS
jgi:hypothetical protein